jgi:Lsr2 protein
MAQHTIVQLVDDLDGTNSDTVHTVEFGLDGVTYEIDLNDDHASQHTTAWPPSSRQPAAPAVGYAVEPPP